MKDSFENTMKELAKMREMIDLIHSQIMDENQTTEVENTEPETFTFTKEQLVIYSGHLIDRTMKVVVEAIESTSIDEEDAVDLELSYHNQIEITLKTDEITDVFVSTVQSSIDTESDAIEEEMLSILEMMKDHQ
jgi:hypothetical protein